MAVLLLGWFASGPGGGGGGSRGPVRRHDDSWSTAYFGDNPALRLLGAYGFGGGARGAGGRRAGKAAGAGDSVPGHGGPGVRALVLYAYAGHADPEAPANLRYFMREAVAGDRAAHYLVAVELPPGHPARVAAEAEAASAAGDEGAAGDEAEGA
jgi:hypothetical protein